MEWQPIETAPNDGSRFLAWCVQTADEYDEEDFLVAENVREEFAVVAYFVFGGIVQFPWNGGVPVNLRFTHWQPLPEGPSDV